MVAATQYESMHFGFAEEGAELGHRSYVRSLSELCQQSVSK